MYPALLTGSQSYSLNNLGYFFYLRVKILPRCECSSESVVSPESKPPFLFLLSVSGSTSPYKNSFSTAASQRREKSKGKRPDVPTGGVGWGDLFTPLGLSSLIGAKQGQKWMNVRVSHCSDSLKSFVPSFNIFCHRLVFLYISVCFRGREKLEYYHIFVHQPLNSFQVKVAQSLSCALLFW